MFLQIHTLTSYHASLLNRDEAGLAKRIPFGDGIRLRVSSQCQKRHWREQLQQTIDLPDGIRSREFFSREVFPRVTNSGVEESLARMLTETLISKIIQGGQDGDKPLFTKQPVLFGRPEADYMVKLLVDCAESGDAHTAKQALTKQLKASKANFKAMLLQAGHGNLYAGLEGALFGRFVTSDILARSDASVHVAHAFTVHTNDSTVDYFNVVDDLNLDEETGAAHAGDMDLGAGLFYGYVAIDIPLLVSNLTGCSRAQWLEQDPADTRDVLNGLIKAIATVSPGAKLGSTAPYARADFVLLETGADQPRSLANAYLEAQRIAPGQHPMQQAVDSLGSHLRSIDQMYGTATGKRFAASTQSVASLGEIPCAPMNETIDKALDTLFGG